MGGWIKSLGKDSLVYGIGYGVSRFLQIIILPIIAHALTVSEFGYYSNYVIFYNFAGGLLILGLDSAVARYFYDSEDKKYHQQLFSSAFYFILLLSFLSIAIFFLFPSVLSDILNIPADYLDSAPYVLLSVPAVALNGFFLSWFKWKREKIKFLINSGGTVVLLLIPLALARQISFIYVFMALFWSQFIVALVSVFLASDYIRFYFNRSLMRSLLKYGFPWMLVFLFGSSRTYLDRVFLTRFLDGEAYGLYNFSVRIATLLSLVTTAFDMAFGPLAFSIWNKEGAPSFFARLQSAYTFAISVIACGVSISSACIIQLMGGSKYAGSEKIVPLLLFAAIPLSLINFSNLGTVYAKKSFLSAFSLFTGFAAVLALNIIFTHRYLQYGATSASLIGHLLIVVVGYWLSRKYYKIPFAYAKDGFVFIFFFLLSLAAVHFPATDGMYLNLIVQLFVLAAIASLFLYFLFSPECKKALSLIKGMRFAVGEDKRTNI